MALITNVSSKKTQFYSCKIHQFSSMFKVAFSLVLFSRKLGSKLTFRNWRDFLEPSCVSWLQSAEAAAADYASILVDAKASAFVVFRHLFTYLYRRKLLVMMLFSNSLHFLRNKDFFSISTFLFWPRCSGPIVVLQVTHAHGVIFALCVSFGILPPKCYCSLFS